ncbi:hypothetical protein [Pseudomonas sp. SWRI18]|uniref:hypothetical protein n=1 Tax=Pseudomonas sp. SWRI18 TaxID=2753888 RepID=UPI001EE305B1|nr:hypothetical protein [Pseudomonas sp. SWRI18]
MQRLLPDLNLIRRGTSLDKVQLDLCKANGIRVVNTPGINAPHVAAYIAHWPMVPCPPMSAYSDTAT